MADKTILTTPHIAGQSDADFLTNTPNPQFLWVGGRHVGAAQANRNNAFWAPQI